MELLGAYPPSLLEPHEGPASPPPVLRRVWGRTGRRRVGSSVPGGAGRRPRGRREDERPVADFAIFVAYYATFISKSQRTGADRVGHRPRADRPGADGRRRPAGPPDSRRVLAETRRTGRAWARAGLDRSRRHKSRVGRRQQMSRNRPGSPPLGRPGPEEGSQTTMWCAPTPGW
jgi:hypothetical protein